MLGVYARRPIVKWESSQALDAFADGSLPRGASAESAARCEAFPVADQSLPRGAGASDSDVKSLRVRIERHD